MSTYLSLETGWFEPLAFIKGFLKRCDIAGGEAELFPAKSSRVGAPFLCKDRDETLREDYRSERPRLGPRKGTCLSVNYGRTQVTAEGDTEGEGRIARNMKMSALKGALCVVLVFVALSVSGVRADEHEDYDFYQNVEYTGHDEVNVSSATPGWWRWE